MLEVNGDLWLHQGRMYCKDWRIQYGYRPLVMDYFNDCVRRYDKNLKVELRTNQFNTNQEKAAKDDGVAELVSQNAAESDVDKNDSSSCFCC
jgi:hypothetical protein